MKRKIIMLLLGLSIISFTACGTTVSTNNEVPTMSESTEVITEEVVKEEPTEVIYTYTDMDKVLCSTSNRPIRDLPTEEGNEVGTLTCFEDVKITGQCNETDWYRIDYNGMVAYADNNYFKDLEKENQEWLAKNNGNDQFTFTPDNKPVTETVSEEKPKEVLGYNKDEDAIIGYDDHGNEIIGYTDDGYPIHRYDTDGVPIIMFYPEENTSNNSNPSNSSNSSNSSNPSLPYIINGIDIRTGDWNGDGINDNNGNTWYEGQTWTASNGYVLKIADQYYVQPGALNGNDAVFRDGTENLEPTSPFKQALNEYFGITELCNISPKDLPKVNTVSTKQTSINVNDPSFVAYKTAFDPLWKQQNGGNESELFAASNGIGLLDTSLGRYYLWSIKYNEDSGDWTFGVKGSYTELGWNAVKNSIRMITPDADAVFDTIYKACYHGGTGLECKKYEETDWITVGSTQIKTDWTSGTLYYRFK